MVNSRSGKIRKKTTALRESAAKNPYLRIWVSAIVNITSPVVYATNVYIPSPWRVGLRKTFRGYG